MRCEGVCKCLYGSGATATKTDEGHGSSHNAAEVNPGL